MKLINKIFFSLSFVSFALSNLEAKSIEFFLDHKIQDTFHLEAKIPEQMQEQPFAPPSFLSYCQQLKLENVGDHPLKDCFPYVNQPPSLTVEALASKLAKEQYPVLALYRLWSRSIVRDDSTAQSNIHPLDLLNFKAVCSSEEFNHQFIKLCYALGIETRFVNVQGKQLYDFGLDDEWHFLDLINRKFYLELNNEKLASSEKIMDDPFLALRTQHARQAKGIDFKEAWKEFAHFEILAPTSAMPLVLAPEDFSPRGEGFDIFPGEVLLFETPDLHPELALNQCFIEHMIHLKARHIVNKRWNYLSPFPIHKLVNNSEVNIWLLDQKIKLKPGESFVFNEQNLFKVRIAFSNDPKGQLVFSGTCAWTLFPALKKGKNQIHLGVEKNPTLIRFNYEVNEELEQNLIPSIQVLNQTHTFDYCSPYFTIESHSNQVESIWWQIGWDDHFQVVPPNFDQVEPLTSTVTLPPISETFLREGNTYYFRVKGFSQGKWGEWSVPFPFVVKKPAAVEEVEFYKIDENEYELNWERYADVSDSPIEYLVFGSNSFDFIPSIYCEKQVNAIVDGEVTEEEANDNLVAITIEPKIRVQGRLAYYRIVAKERGQLSVPSSLIHVYDQELIQPRNVLQVVKDEHQFLAKRMLFPASYPWTKISLPPISSPTQKSLIRLQSLLRSFKNLTKIKYPYELPEVSEEVWAQIRPYILPENHPAWAQLNRVFCNSRATLSPEQFKKAGFRRWRPGRWSRVAASSHPEFPEYFIKAYCDSELGIIYDWKKWLHRIEGAETIRKCIKDYKLQSYFRVPHKWIYPLPKQPTPPKSSHYLRKNFILVCENMRIQEHSTNEKMYKHKMNHQLIEGLYTVLQVCGLYDSVYIFNIPFCKDGRIAVIDTEYHHKWPIPFYKLNKAFSKDLQSYWRKITYKGGTIPDGIPQTNPPRMDRRDIVK